MQWTWATLAGPDARDFIQRVTSADARNLAVGCGTRGCFLTPQGRLRAYFHLWRYGEDEFGFEFDAGDTGKWRDELFAAIDQFTFGEKMTLTPITGLECRWIFANTDSELSELLQGLEPGQTRAIDEEIRLCHEGSIDFGRPWVTAWGRPARIEQWAERTVKFNSIDFNTIESWRVAALRPRVDRELTEMTVPLEAGLTDAIAANKGCYPGQEVIEKIVSLGSPAKRLALIAGEGDMPQTAAPLWNVGEPATEVGNLTTVVKDGNGWRALGYVRKNYAKPGLEVRINNAASGKNGTLQKISNYE